MPSIWSKIIQPEWSLPYNCYEIGHTWTPSCEEAALDMTFTVFAEALKLYTPLYLCSALFKKKFDSKEPKRIAANVLRSSSFLAFSTLLMMTVFCNIRRFSGKFYYTLCAFMPVFISSLFSILIEKPSRRGALAVYCANIASETVFRMMSSRHYIKPVHRGEVIIFTLTMSALLYTIRRHGYGRDAVSFALKFILGPQEAGNYAHKSVTFSDQNDNFLYLLKFKTRPAVAADSVWRQFKLLTVADRCLPRHASCPHSSRVSCPTNCLIYFVRNFSIGWLFQSVLSTVSKPKMFVRSPLTVLSSKLSDRRNIYFGLFLGAFSAVYKSVNCALRWKCNGSRDWHAMAASLLAGPFMLLSPNTTIAMYLLWKYIETVYSLLVRSGRISVASVKPTIMLLYAMSTAQIAYALILEPTAMRESYVRFIERVTGNRLNSFNRLVLDVFGTGASKGFENKFPDLCLKHTTRQFQENVITWLI